MTWNTRRNQSKIIEAIDYLAIESYFPCGVPQVKQGAEWMDTKEVAGRARPFVDGCVLPVHT